MKKLFAVICVALFALSVTATNASAAKDKAKFYDFSDQLIDGEIKKPTALYTDSRSQVKFDRLLDLKKSFIQPLLQTAQERVFK